MNGVVKISNARSDLSKVITAVAVLSGFVVAPSIQAGETMGPEAFRVGLDYSLPGADDNWDGGMGVRVQALFPAKVSPEMSDKYKLGFSLGVTSWDANEDSYSATFNSVNVTGNLSGDVRSVNLGASFLRSDMLDNGLNLTSEIGLVFSSISSDTKVVYTSSNVTPSEQDLDIDDTVLGIIAVDANFAASEDMSAFVGIGYQFDLGASDAAISNDSEKNYTNALFIRAGVQF